MRRLLTSAGTLAAAFVAAAGCGGGGSDEKAATKASTATSSAAPASAPAGTRVTIRDFKYAPPSISATVGGKLTFANADNAEHTATADTKSAFDTGAITHGRSKAITLTKAGSFPYHCDFHPFMHGTVIVKGSSAGASSTSRSARPAAAKPPKPAPSKRSAKDESGRNGGVEGGTTGY